MTLLDELLLETYRLAIALDLMVEDMVENLPIIPSPTVTKGHTGTEILVSIDPTNTNTDTQFAISSNLS